MGGGALHLRELNKGNVGLSQVIKNSSGCVGGKVDNKVRFSTKIL